MIQTKDALSDKDSAIEIVEAWMRFEERSYYRLQQPGADRLLFYDVDDQQGLYYSPDLGEVELGPLHPSRITWEDDLSNMVSLARGLESRMRLLLPRPETLAVTEEASTQDRD